jgi:hypothetical protein
MMGVPVWFKSLIYSEIFLQLPFFFVAAYALMGAPVGVLCVLLYSLCCAFCPSSSWQPAH